MVNLPFTVLLGLIVLYWLLVALGALDVHLFSDVDGDLHHDMHHEADHDLAGFTKVLHFVGIGDVPVMVIVSVLGLAMWLCSMLANFYLTDGSQLYALALYLYSLQLPENPHKPTETSRRGEKIFHREGCQHCHTPRFIPIRPAAQ